MSKTHELMGNPQTGNSSLGVVSRCAFSVYVEDCGRLIVIAKDEDEVSEKMKSEGFTKPFKIIEGLSFIA